MGKIKNQIEKQVKELASKLPKTEKSENDFLMSKSNGLTIELYEEDLNYEVQDVLKKIIKRANQLDYLYAYCLHDQDYYTSNTFDSNKKLIGKKGDKKKNHYHVVLSFNYPTCISDVVGDLGVPTRFIKKLRNALEIDNMLLYLSHIKYPNKHQYHENGDVSKTIVSNRFDYVQWLHYEYKPKSAIKYAVKYVEENKGYLLIKDFFNQYDEDGMEYNEFIKTYKILKDIIYEHNQEFDFSIHDEDKIALERAKALRYKAEVNKKNMSKEKQIRTLAETFGTTRTDFDGKEMLVVNIEKDKKIF